PQWNAASLGELRRHDEWEQEIVRYGECAEAGRRGGRAYTEVARRAASIGSSAPADGVLGAAERHDSRADPRPCSGRQLRPFEKYRRCRQSRTLPEMGAGSFRTAAAEFPERRPDVPVLHASRRSAAISASLWPSVC